MFEHGFHVEKDLEQARGLYMAALGEANLISWGAIGDDIAFVDALIKVKNGTLPPQ